VRFVVVDDDAADSLTGFAVDAFFSCCPHADVLSLISDAMLL